MKKVFYLIVFAIISSLAFDADAILYKCDNFNSSKKTCRLIGWHGSLPTSGKLKLPSTFTDDDGTVYTITVVAEDALNNLTNVTEITIAASYKEFGDVSSKSIVNSATENFKNCPNLKLFKVEAGSPLFEATTDGLLFLKGKLELLNVPAQFATTGRFVLPDYCEYISKDAFADNSSINTLLIPRNVSIDKNGGFNRMTELSRIELVDASEKKLSLNNGVLISKEYSDTRVVSLPPYFSLITWTMPQSVTEISEYAFANCKAFTEIILPSKLVKIGSYAFSNSAIESVKFTANVEQLGKNMFENSKSLHTITFENVNPEIPDRFASGCTSLQKVESKYPIVKVGEAAFKNCRELNTFPFRGETVLDEDSSFYNTGFEKIVFEESEMADYFSGSNVFSFCRNLKELDFSRLIMQYPGNGLGIGDSYAANCLKLKTVKFGDYTGFWSYPASMGPTPPAFGYSCVLDTIRISSTEGSKFAQFCYSPANGVMHFTPKVYATLTTNEAYSEFYDHFYIEKLFSAGNGATVAPIIFVDAYKLATPKWPEYRDYVVPDATYFVPGGTVSNYDSAVSKGNRVEEMFGISFDKSNPSYLKITITPRKGVADLPEVTDFTAQFENGTTARPDANGVIKSPTSVSATHYVKIHYFLDGVHFYTNYPSGHWSTSDVTEISDSTFEYKIENGRIIFSAPLFFEIYSTDGMKVKEGFESDVDLSSLTSGIYLVKLTRNNETKTFKIYI